MEKMLVEIDNVEFDSRFQRYYGYIGEMMAEEFLVRRGFSARSSIHHLRFFIIFIKTRT